MPCPLWGNIHLHTISNLQYLPPDVRQIAVNVFREAGKKWLSVAGFGYI